MSETITGQGQLKIGGDMLDVSFSFPAGPCQPEALLPGMQRFANQITDLATARIEAAGLRISCAKGCGACCRQMVPVSPAEARHLASVVEAMPPERAAAVRERFTDARNRLADSGFSPQGHPDTDKIPYRLSGLAYFAARVPCPFLEEESCSIHPDRPLVCREYIVTSPPAACSTVGSSGVQKVAMPVRVWNVFARSSAPDGQARWMPLTEALAFAEANPAPPPVRTGPEYMDAFLKELSRSPDPPSPAA